MSNTGQDTHFLPHERQSDSAVRESHKNLLRQPYIATLMDSFPEPVMILNAERQIVMANQKLEAMLGMPAEKMLGQRLGELLNCVHASENRNGCGTSSFCKYCGAARAIMRCDYLYRAQEEECRIAVNDGDGSSSLDLMIRTRSLEVDGENYRVFSLKNTTDIKRREVLERIFFHDVLNMAGALDGLLDLVLDCDPAESAELSGDARQVSTQLIEDIQSQRDLAAAERGDLTVEAAEIEVSQILGELKVIYSHQLLTPDVALNIIEVPKGLTLLSDHRLLRRVLVNLVKNAIEACKKGDEVTVRWDVASNAFHVHNPGVMTESVRAQIFNRSFSTKKTPGRGIGTYSIKLLTEKYLGGTVTFESIEHAGTTFTVSLPSA